MKTFVFVCQNLDEYSSGFLDNENKFITSTMPKIVERAINRLGEVNELFRLLVNSDVFSWDDSSWEEHNGEKASSYLWIGREIEGVGDFYNVSITFRKPKYEKQSYVYIQVEYEKL